MCGEKCKETWVEAPRPAGEPASCLKIVQIGVMFIKMHKFAQKSSFLLTQSIQHRSPRLRAVQSRCPHGL